MNIKDQLPKTLSLLAGALGKKPESEIKTFCLANKPPVYPLPNEIPIIWLNSSPPPANEDNIYWPVGTISNDLEALHPFLGSASGAFAIEILLRNRAVPWAMGDRVSIIHYRKFTSNIPLGKEAPNYPGMQLINPSSLKQFNLHEIQHKIKTSFLIPQLYTPDRGLYAQYTTAHKAQDLLRYLAIAIDMGIISGEESHEFLTAKYLIPGGIEAGIYPISVFLEIIKSLRSVTMEFVKHHVPTSLDPYQRRALAFCNERLGSYLLYNYLIDTYNGSIPPEYIGYMHNVTTEGDYIVG